MTLSLQSVMISLNKSSMQLEENLHQLEPSFIQLIQENCMRNLWKYSKNWQICQKEDITQRWYQIETIFIKLQGLVLKISKVAIHALDITRLNVIGKFYRVLTNIRLKSVRQFLRITYISLEDRTFNSLLLHARELKD